MPNLYLVRKSLENYIGPFTLAELKDQYKQMEFGLQDEVAGNCGKWITFDNVLVLRRHYPDLARLVQEDFLGGWAVSENSSKRISEKQNPRQGSRKKSGLGLGFSLILVLIFLAVAALYFAQGAKFPTPFFESSEFPEYEQVRKHVEYRELEDFEGVMDSLLPKILPKVNRSRKTYNEWIPFIRLLAFRRDGTVPGLKAKLLRGMGTFSAPLDCSVEAWRTRWLDAKDDWDKVLQGNLVQAEWAKVLLWDPYWVRHRNRVIGWQMPSNYYEGCLLMAEKSLDDLRKKKSPGPVPPAAFLQRIRSILAVVQGQPQPAPSADGKLTGFFAHLVCMETAATKTALDQCKYKAEPGTESDRLLEQYRTRNEIRIFVDNNAFVTDDNLANLSKLHRTLKPIDDYTGFNYTPENKFLVAIMLNQGSVREAAKRMRYEFPEVNFEF